MKKWILIFFFTAVFLCAFAGGPAETVCASAFSSHKSNFQTQGSGQVIKVLSDDNSGGRHQRFIIKLSSGQTLLIAHNIDLAKQGASIKTGDFMEFSGEYEWNPQGGVIHWTHRDPQGKHSSGWIKHNGQIYQ